jgi:SMC interacting uncharacterized protein involved in chromosome segregation
MSETVNFQTLQIQALQREVERLNNIISDKDIEIEQLKVDVLEERSQYNMLARNIEVIDEVYLQPIKK